MTASPLERAFVAGLQPVEAIPTRLGDFLRWVGLPPSPAVEAICDASEGRPVTTVDDATSERIFGCGLGALPTAARRVVAIEAGGRGGKTSRLLAPRALLAALTVPLPTLARGEHAVALLVGPRQLEAQQALNFVRGMLASRPELERLVTNRLVTHGSSRLGATEMISIRRTDGHHVDIRIGVAGSGGISARARTLVFAGLDEAAFFHAEGEKTDVDLYQAAIQRVVPGGQVWLTSTPYIDGVGVLATHLARDFGKHALTLCVRGVGTRMLNPTWDPDGSIEAQMRGDDPDNAAREIDAVPLVAGSKLYFPPDLLDPCVNKARPRLLEFDRTMEYLAAADFAFRTNSSSLAIASTDGHRMRIAYIEEVRPTRGEPLVPSEVAAGFGDVLERYGAFDLLTDYHEIESMRENFGALKLRDPRDHRMAPTRRGVSLSEFNPSTMMEAAFARVRSLMAEGRVELPNDPRLLSQLRLVASKPLAGGRSRIVLPRIGASHGDLAVAVVMALSRYEDNAYGRKLEQLDRVMRGQKPETKSAAQTKEEADLERMRRMTRMPKAG